MFLLTNNFFVFAAKVCFFLLPPKLFRFICSSARQGHQKGEEDDEGWRAAGAIVKRAKSLSERWGEEGGDGKGEIG